MRPLLSICIPTYNRSANLRRTLDSIVLSEGFGEEVEIVISDNASTDNTPEVTKEYTEKYSNIRYFRNEENMRDFNFPLALDRGTGVYVKLNNDNRIFVEGALKYMLDAIREHQIEKKPLFFTNTPVFNTKRGDDEVVCYGLNDFVIHLSYYSTGIWIFGAWKEDWNAVKDKMKYSPLQLSQVDWFYQIVINKGGCILKTRLTTYTEDVGKRTGYKWFKVHIDNYYTIIRPYYETGLISKKAYSKDRRLQLQRMKLPLTSTFVYNLMPPGWEYDMSGAPSIFWNNFKEYPYFYLYILLCPFWMMKLLLGRLAKNILKHGRG